ncbi:hypothetical protein LN042_22985 [Kitasatospora sp. RB6PN24]|uniref:hypothetical protein n=1 Tax=Kitasatospora humi TaxID=2893891 RepID=UPI001E50FFD1|nr:hypothetical protein [Kitasatospora humi]MCC9309901.1 hypothetical protein [Kitasatospora humi]
MTTDTPTPYQTDTAATARRLVAAALTGYGLTETALNRQCPEQGRRRGFLTTGDAEAVTVTMHPLPMTARENRAVVRALLRQPWQLEIAPDLRSVTVRPGRFDWRGPLDSPLLGESVRAGAADADHAVGYERATLSKRGSTEPVTYSAARTRHEIASLVEHDGGRVEKWPNGMLLVTSRGEEWRDRWTYYWPAAWFNAAPLCRTCQHTYSEHKPYKPFAAPGACGQYERGEKPEVELPRWTRRTL